MGLMGLTLRNHGVKALGEMKQAGNVGALRTWWFIPMVAAFV
jgi:hypothetical protein